MRESGGVANATLIERLLPEKVSKVAGGRIHPEHVQARVAGGRIPMFVKN